MSWNPPAVSQADIDLLTNLNHHLLHAAAISRSIALRWGIKPLDPEALGLSSFDRAEHDHLAKRPKQPPPPRPYPIAPPPDGPSLERTRPFDGPNPIPHSAHSWRHASPVHRLDEANSESVVPVRRRSSEHPSSVSSPNHLPDSESDRTIEARPSKNCKPTAALNEDDDMSLDEMILNVADGEESAGGKTIKAPQRKGAALMIEAPSPRTLETARESHTGSDRRKNRNNSNQHGQLRAIAHRVPQPIADPLPPDPSSRTHNSTPPSLTFPPSAPNPESRSIMPHMSTLDYRFSSGTGTHALTLSPPVDASFNARGAQDRSRDAHIAFAPLHGPDNLGVDHERSMDAHHVRKPAPVNERICSQCGRPGRLKDGRSVEKWGPGPDGPGTVCDRCRKKMKRVEKRGTADPALIIPNNIRVDGMANPPSGRYSRSPEIERASRHRAEDNSPLPHHPHPHHPSHATFSQPKPSFLSRDKDPILDVLEDSRYSSSTNIQPVSDIRSESSTDNIHSRGKDRGGRSKGKDTGRARRRAPTFSPSRSPSPHSILEHTNTPPASPSHKRSKSLASSHPADDASSLLEQELLETASHPSHSRPHDRDFDSDATTTQFRNPQISPVGSTSDGTVVDGIASLGSSTAPSSAAFNSSFPNGDSTAQQQVGSPLVPPTGQLVSSPHPLTRSVLGKRRSPPEGDATVSDVERQRQKKGDIVMSGAINGAMPQHVAQQPDAHDILASTYASDGVNTVR